MSVRVDNYKTWTAKEGETAVYVGRPNPNVVGVVNMPALGNKYHMTGENDRALVISMYRVWLERAVDEEKDVRDAMLTLIEMAKRGPIVLLCWCHPKACHADIIAAMVKQAIGIDTQMIQSMEEDRAMERAELYGAIDEEVDQQIEEEFDCGASDI